MSLGANAAIRRRIDLDDERERRAALLPPNARCESCAEEDPLVLVADARLVLCADCEATRLGRVPEEEHHVAGRRYSTLTVRVSANEHRRLTIRQRLWLYKPSLSVAEALRYGLGDLLDEDAAAFMAAEQ